MAHASQWLLLGIKEKIPNSMDERTHRTTVSTQTPSSTITNELG
jgi:hypothetical protein